jgi:ATP-dependent helicase/nuclease subunit B
MTAIAITDGWAQLLRQVEQERESLGAHPSRTVLLLPFFQLQQVAREAWRSLNSSGFMPRIETTKSWQQRVAQFEPQEWDITFDGAQDFLCARKMLLRAGLADHLKVLTPMLLEAGQQLGAVAATLLPQDRAAWAQRLRPVVRMSEVMGESDAPQDAQLAQLESAVALIALEWAAASGYASDALFEMSAAHEVDLLVVVRGLQAEQAVSMAASLAARRLEAGAPVHWLDLPQTDDGILFTHKAQDAEDEAQRAAACVQAHLASSRLPVALPAIDRQTTRRISAMLSERGITLLDETGWRLSTTRSATQIMSLLRAAHPLSSEDEQLDWLKHCAVSAQALAQWEKQLRKPNRQEVQVEYAVNAIEFIVSEEKPFALLATLRAARALGQWRADLRQALDVSGQWAALQGDSAGQQVIQALRLEDTSAANAASVAADAQRLSSAELIDWVQAALESASFKVPQPALQQGEQAQVVILPLAQLAGRSFAAAVLAGCDEIRLPLAPEPKGLWSAAQREALGLPSREALMQEQQAAWQRAMQVPQVDALWRSAQGEEALAPSPLLQAWRMHRTAKDMAQSTTQHIRSGVDARLQVELQGQPQAMPAPSAAALATGKFSASSYADVRTCPYRYFALRLLGLSEAQELDAQLSKRDFGAWLHEVLSEFHLARPRDYDAAQDAQLLDACAARSAEKYAHDAGFVPFAAAWPQVAASYLSWLAQHESQGWRFESSELALNAQAGDAQLQGRLDRVDVLAGSNAQSFQVMDYKTESEQGLKARVAQPLEDTQLVFYAALLGKDDVQASYVSLSEKATKTVAQQQIEEALPMLLAGLQSDAQRMQAGHALPAHGEGKACEYCAARGLCRKDFWEAA